MTENEKKNYFHETEESWRTASQQTEQTHSKETAQKSAEEQRLEELLGQQRSTGKKRNIYIRMLVPLVLVAVLLVAGGIYIRQRLTRYYESLDPVDLVWDILEDQLVEASDEEDDADSDGEDYIDMIKRLYRLEQEGVYDFSIASTIVFESPDSSGEARIENTGYHFYDMWLTIRLDDSQEYIYSSDTIDPFGSEETIDLAWQLEPGEYNATVTFYAMSFAGDGFYGQKEAAIKLYVLDGKTSKEKVLSEEDQKDLKITMDTDSEEQDDTAVIEEEEITEEEVESGLLDQFGKIFEELLS